MWYLWKVTRPWEQNFVMGLVSLEEEEEGYPFLHSQSWEDPARRRLSARGPSPCWHPDPRSPASRTMSRTCICLSHKIYDNPLQKHEMTKIPRNPKYCSRNEECLFWMHPSIDYMVEEETEWTWTHVNRNFPNWNVKEKRITPPPKNSGTVSEGITYT